MENAGELYDDYKARCEKIRQLGGKKAVDEQHKQGKWTARERIEYFFDPNTFVEIGMHVKHRAVHFGMDKKEVSAEGVITGYGKVNGRYVVATADDYTSMAGSFGEYHGKKFVRAIEFAKENGWPIVGMNDSGGLRLQEGVDGLEAYGWLFRAQIMASGIVPQIALMMGPCLGGQAYHPIMQDFIIMCRKTGFMGIAGPSFVKTMTGEDISLEKLSGVSAHAVKSGCAHMIAEDDKDCLDKAKELLEYFPSSNKGVPPEIKTAEDPEKTIPELDSILPKRDATPYDMHLIIKRIVDGECFFEIMKDHAPNVITGFGRFNGRSTGIVASQPNYMGGALDCDAADKVARFVRTCDLFNIPLVNIHDTPGFLIGSESDWKGILRHGAKMLYAYADATVPLISVIVRKSYAGAHYAMCDKSIGGDLIFAWPNSRITAVSAETAASVIFAKEISRAEKPEDLKKQRIEEYRATYENVYCAAERGFVDEIIMPHDTRNQIIRALDALKNKSVTRPWRKYSNINL